MERNVETSTGEELEKALSEAQRLLTKRQKSSMLSLVVLEILRLATVMGAGFAVHFFAVKITSLRTGIPHEEIADFEWTGDVIVAMAIAILFGMVVYGLHQFLVSRNNFKLLGPSILIAVALALGVSMIAPASVYGFYTMALIAISVAEGYFYRWCWVFLNRKERMIMLRMQAQQKIMDSMEKGTFVVVELEKMLDEALAEEMAEENAERGDRMG